MDKWTYTMPCGSERWVVYGDGRFNREVKTFDNVWFTSSYSVNAPMPAAMIHMVKTLGTYEPGDSLEALIKDLRANGCTVWKPAWLANRLEKILEEQKYTGQCAGTKA